MSGSAGDVVQARDISGGVHFYVPAAAPAVVPRLLRADVAGFVGRQEELQALAVIAGQGRGLRLAVVTGTAGVGKTSLALRFAHQVRSSFPGGDLFVDLRGYDSGAPLPPAVALERFLRALGIAAEAIPRELEERAELYRSVLAGRRVLVVLDNAATAGQVRPLLPGDEESLVVVTSRSRLLGLSARDGARRVSVGLLDQDSAIELIASVTGGYRGGDDRDDVAVLAGLCARLPLALRIAAERAAARPLMPLAELIGDLRSRQGLWEALSAGDEQEADAVRTVFAWSYRALPQTAARAFRLLGLHPGPELGIGAAAALTGLSAPETRTMLEVLAGAHLLEQTGPTRYQFHDLLRAFAADAARADEDEQERQAAFGRLVGWYLHSADAACQMVDNVMPSVVTGPPPHGIEPERFSGHRQAVDWYGIERANLLALISVLDRSGQARPLWQLAATIKPLINAYGSADDRQVAALAGLRAAQAMNDHAAEARSLRDLASSERLDFALAAAARHYQEALTAYQALGDTVSAINAANGLGLIRLALRDFDEAFKLLSDAAGQARGIGDHRLAAVIKVNEALTLQEQGRPTEALGTAEQALADLAESGYQGSMFGEAYSVIIRACTELGRWEQAEQHLNAIDQLTAEGTDLALRVLLLIDHADMALAMGRPGLAADLLWQAENLGRSLGNLKAEAMVLSGIGRALDAQGRSGEAVDLYRRAVALRRRLPDAFLLAEALSHLTDALTADGILDEAAATRAEASGLLTGFGDPRAVALRDHLVGRTPDTNR